MCEGEGERNVTQEAPRRHPGDTQDAPRRHPEAPRAPGDISESAESNKFYHQKCRRRPFYMDGSDVNLTVPAACAQESESANLARNAFGGKASLPRPLESYS